MKWTFENGIPIYLQILGRLRTEIASGAYPPGAKLPAVRELALEAGVNPNTMQRALTELERDGLAQSMGTMGRVVTNDHEKINQLRKNFAQELVHQYLSGMKRLGYDAVEAYREMEEWIHD